jgi:hypothetical protein
MNPLRGLFVSLVACSFFVSSLVRADDCSNALMAESCACRSDVRSDREQLKSSDKISRSDSHFKARKGHQLKLAERAKSTLASSASASRD